MIFIAYLDEYKIIDMNKIIEDGFNIFINLSSNMGEITNEFINKNKNKLWFTKTQLNDDNSGYNYIEHFKIILFPENNKTIIINDFEGIITRHIRLYKQMIEAKRRYGLIINGRLTCYEENLIPVIFNYLNKNKDEWIDVHINLNENKDKLKEYLNYPYINLPFIKTIDCNKYDTNDYYINFPNNKCQNPHTLMSSFYTLMKAFVQLNYYKIRNKINYDLIIKYRPDIITNELPDLKTFLFLKNRSNEIYTPFTAIFGFNYKSNDQIAIGNYDSMSVYCSIYPYIDNYLKDEKFGIYHPETLLANHLFVFDIKINLFDFNYSLNPNRNNLRLIDNNKAI